MNSITDVCIAEALAEVIKKHENEPDYERFLKTVVKDLVEEESREWIYNVILVARTLNNLNYSAIYYADPSMAVSKSAFVKKWRKIMGKGSYETLKTILSMEKSFLFFKSEEVDWINRVLPTQYVNCKPFNEALLISENFEQFQVAVMRNLGVYDICDILFDMVKYSIDFLENNKFEWKEIELNSNGRITKYKKEIAAKRIKYSMMSYEIRLPEYLRAMQIYRELFFSSL